MKAFPEMANTFLAQNSNMVHSDALKYTGLGICPTDS